MKRLNVIGASMLLGAIFGVAGTMSVVQTASIDTQPALPTPSKCESLTVADLLADPNYTSDSALIQALSILPDDLPLLRCNPRK
jgi:hypothetical protein